LAAQPSQTAALIVRELGLALLRQAACEGFEEATPSHRAAIALEKVETISVAFTREESAETAAEVELPDRPISQHPNLVTEPGPEVLANALAKSHATDNAAQQIEDAGERPGAFAVASRETRYFADRLRTARVVPPPVEFGTVVFGHNVTFKRDDR
jgi:hypothetical protein